MGNRWQGPRRGFEHTEAAGHSAGPAAMAPGKATLVQAIERAEHPAGATGRDASPRAPSRSSPAPPAAGQGDCIQRVFGRAGTSAAAGGQPPPSPARGKTQRSIGAGGSAAGVLGGPDQAMAGAGAGARGAASPPTGLPEAARRRLEHGFGMDLSSVRVHPDSPAASAIGAEAFAQGSEIHFAPGRYDASGGDLHLLAHEVAHVVQQADGRVAAPQAKGVPINDDASLEGEADAAAARVVAGEAAVVGTTALRATAGRSPEAPVQRRKVALPDKEIETDEYQLDELIAMQSELGTSSTAYAALGEEIQAIRAHRADSVAAFPELGRTGFYREIAPPLVGNPAKRQNYCERRYGRQHGAVVFEMIGQLANRRGEDFFELMVDPGLMSPSHLEPFVHFAMQPEQLAEQRPWVLRDAYAYSGKAHKAYRGLYLGEDDAKKIGSEGNFAGAVRGLRGPGKEALRAQVMKGELDLGEMFDTPIADVMRSRITARSMEKYFFDDDETSEAARPKKQTAEGSLSVSSSPLIASAVAASEFGGYDPERGKDVYLLGAGLSPVDALNPEDYGLGLSQNVRAPEGIPETVKGGALESFVLGGIMPGQEMMAMTREQAPYPKLTR